MLRSMLIAVFVHVFLLSICWIGFPVVLLKKNVLFIYSGTFMPVISSDKGERPRNVQDNDVINESPSSAFFTPWVQMRSLDKPKD